MPSLVRAGVPEDRAGMEFFETKIRPVLVTHCYRCHSGTARNPRGSLRVDSREAIRRGGASGPAIVPGKVADSLLIEAIEQTGDLAPMPPKGKLPASVVADFRAWIERGAPDPRDTAATAVPLPDPAWWSLQPIARPSVPELPAEARSWARTPIDAFILARLRAAGLTPAPEADRRTLIRRLSFDLIGLPPTPEEIADFLADPAPDAYERLVDRLLASPHYGERWARHWMDVVHFAETHGHDQDRIRPNAWPYRDYLIESFNRDTPYARFIEEQLAADVLFPDEPRLTVALGLIAAGPWDESSLRDIREDSIDRQVGHYLDRDDMVATVMSTFVSTTVHCARCHDHKFDPIPQQDYYNLQAVFAGVDRADRAYDPDPAVQLLRRSLDQRRRGLQRRDPAVLESLLLPEVQAEVAAWEAEVAASRTPWTPLDPLSCESSAGATLTKQPDGSILSEGKRPAKDTYTIRVRAPRSPITAVRLEVLPDDRLPSRGPGRNENGNLHLTEFRLMASSEPAGEPRPLPVARAVADFDQSGWAVGGAVDGKGETAWGIFPRVGVPHQAVFELKDDLDGSCGVTLIFVLQQTHPENHPIGRFRLSATAAPRPARPSAVPEAIAKLLDVPAADRTSTQRQELAAYVVAGSLDRQLAALPPRRFVYAAASTFEPDGGHKPPPGPRPVHLLVRGDIHHPGALARPGSLSCVPALEARFDLADPAQEAPRRARLARWISDPRNPLTWRSIVNRVWQGHFGRGLVDAPNDFGRMGSRPTHPELLDWLAAQLLADGGSLKRLHRRIVTSAVYRQASRPDPRGAAIDADNRLLWRRSPTRLDAESVRDAILLVSSRLDRTMGGPSVRQFSLSPGVHVTPVVDYTAFDWDRREAGRRSVYRFLFRTLPDPFMESLDSADASQLTPVRTESASPLQALALWNNAFVLRHSEHFARRLRSCGEDLDGRLRAAAELVWGREPTSEELGEWRGFVARHGLEGFCRVLFNSNEFLFVN